MAPEAPTPCACPAGTIAQHSSTATIPARIADLIIPPGPDAGVPARRRAPPLPSLNVLKPRASPLGAIRRALFSDALRCRKRPSLRDVREPTQREFGKHRYLASMMN